LILTPKKESKFGSKEPENRQNLSYARGLSLIHIRLIIAYDGTAYLGWQKTKMGPSIEETLENVLRTILQEDISLQAASRTDAGVHAAGQVASFYTTRHPNLYKLHRALNGLLPQDISVQSIEQVDEAFHPTLQNTGKEYHYHLCLAPIQLPFNRPYSWHVRLPLDVKLMQEGASLLIGTHDFAAFCNNRYGLPKNTVRTLHSIDFVPSSNQNLQVIVKGESFLYKMVRNLVGTLVYVGSGKLNVDSIPLIIKGQDRTQGGITAPAHGLSLHKVYY
jgi:tRNA pseudouridine38-40 synthase